MQRLAVISRILIGAAVLATLIPLGRVVLDWWRVASMELAPAVAPTQPGYDWVVWQDVDGAVTATYVFPRGPAAEAGIQAGDEFYMLDYQQYFSADVLKEAVAGIPPGEKRLFHVERVGQFVEAEVQLTRYPTFLYPLSGTLWRFALWGFALGAFVHLLGLTIAIPLALRSPKARFSLLLIAVSSLWIFSNLVRLVLVELAGPPAPGTAYDHLFQSLTFIGLIGWIGFPTLLLRQVLSDLYLAAPGGVGWMRHLIYLPALVLGLLALGATLDGHIGPFTTGGLIAPILFYAGCYIAAAAALVLAYRLLGLATADDAFSDRPSLVGNAVTLLLALLAALAVLGVVPILGAVTDTTVGWLVVAAQLLSVAPVLLVSLATLRYGKVSHVVSRALAYVAGLGLIFLAFVGGMGLIDPLLERNEAPRTVVAGLYVVVLIVVFERLARRLRTYAADLFATDRVRTRQTLVRFQEQMRSLLSHRTLIQQTIQTVGQAFGARSAILFLRPFGPEGAWLSSTYRPEAPYLTERVVRRVWPHFEEEGRTWSRNPELNESTLPPSEGRLLEERGAALAIPIMGDGMPNGLLVLGPKRQRRAVYNLEDIDLLRALGGQLALAAERLTLVEREKALVRESAEAHLVALRAQINPHFLFNALNTIAALIEEKPDEAEATVEHLAAIFRHTLQAGARAFVTLEEELVLVGHYLAIEQARFGEKLTVERDLDASVAAAPVPAFAVQTLVENAVKHGLERRRGGGRLRLSCQPSEAGGVDIVVHDTGVGIPPLFGQDETAVTEMDFFGLGLRNVAARLRQIYDRADLLRLQSDPEEGTTVTLHLPGSGPESPVASPEPHVLDAEP